MQKSTFLYIHHTHTSYPVSFYDHAVPVQREFIVFSMNKCWRLPCLVYSMQTVIRGQAPNTVSIKLHILKYILYRNDRCAYNDKTAWGYLSSAQYKNEVLTERAAHTQCKLKPPQLKSHTINQQTAWGQGLGYYTHYSSKRSREESPSEQSENDDLTSEGRRYITGNSILTPVII